jgi:hypothetical protein
VIPFSVVLGVVEIVIDPRSSPMPGGEAEAHCPYGRASSVRRHAYRSRRRRDQACPGASLPRADISNRTLSPCPGIANATGPFRNLGRMRRPAHAQQTCLGVPRPLALGPCASIWQRGLGHRTRPYCVFQIVRSGRRTSRAELRKPSFNVGRRIAHVPSQLDLRE